MKPDPDCPYCDGSGTTGGIDNRTCHCMKNEPRPFQKGDRVRHSEAYIAMATTPGSSRSRSRQRGIVVRISRNGQPVVRWDTAMTPVEFCSSCLVRDEHGEAPEASGIEAMVCADIAQRQWIGMAKYGFSVASNPLTRKQWLRHAYEEALDLAIYLRKLIDIEKPNTKPTTNQRDQKP